MTVTETVQTEPGKPIATLERVPLRNVWAHEAYDFTTWLQDNIEVLEEATGLSLSDAERERDVGNYSVDLVAEDEANQLVVIENQLNATDHDHLGKMMVYFANLEAKTGIWISGSPSPEHVQAVRWLNESGLADFYLLKLEAIRIDGSPPAPLLTSIVGPSRESREAGDVKKKFSERHKLRERYWAGLLDYAETKTNLHSNVSPGKYSYLGTGAGHAGLKLNYLVRQHDARAELYIDRDKENGQENLQIFDELYDAKEAIEQELGSKLIWKRLEDKRACRIQTDTVPIGYRDEEDWETSYQPLVEMMVQFERALRPHLESLNL